MSTAFAPRPIEEIDEKYIDQRQMVSEGGPLGPENFHSGTDEAPAEDVAEDFDEDIDEDYQTQREMVSEGGPLGPENFHW